jgi:hypothetical protein
VKPFPGQCNLFRDGWQAAQQRPARAGRTHNVARRCGRDAPRAQRSSIPLRHGCPQVQKPGQARQPRKRRGGQWARRAPALNSY